MEVSGAESEEDGEESGAESEEDKEESDSRALEKAKIPALPKFLVPPVFNPATLDPNSFIDTKERVALKKLMG